MCWSVPIQIGKGPRYVKDTLSEKKKSPALNDFVSQMPGV